MSDLSKNILKNIKKKGVAPKPRWHFLFKRATIWSAFVISIIIGSIAFGVIIVQFMYADWDVQIRLGRSSIGFLLLVMPYFWLVFFTAFSALAFHYFRRTEGGYKYNASFVVIGSLVLSLIGGAIFYSSGLSERMERALHERVPLYEQLKRHQNKIWSAPEKGLLGGKILKIISKKELMIIDLNGEKWQVDISEAHIPPFIKLNPNIQIKIIGEKIDKKKFKAKEIRPWLPPRIMDMFKKMKGREEALRRPPRPI